MEPAAKKSKSLSDLFFEADVKKRLGLMLAGHDPRKFRRYLEAVPIEEWKSKWPNLAGDYIASQKFKMTWTVHIHLHIMRKMGLLKIDRDMKQSDKSWWPCSSDATRATGRIPLTGRGLSAILPNTCLGALRQSKLKGKSQKPLPPLLAHNSPLPKFST